MSRSGRPLRFIAVVLGGWIGVRAYLLWPVPPLLPAVPVVSGPTTPWAPPAAWIAAGIAPGIAPGIAIVPRPPGIVARPVRRPARSPVRRPAAFVPAPHRETIAAEGMSADPAVAAASPVADIVRHGVAQLTPPPSGASRWTAGVWMILRPGGRAGGVATPQLGGSQAGARIAYALNDAARVALVARAAAALDTRQQDAAIGFEWRPAALPVRIVAERRIGVAGVRGGFALGASGGVAARPVGCGFRLDGYAQAGVVGRDGVEGYADGAVRIARPVAGIVDIGIGAWAAAQRDAARLDVGPTVGVAVPAGRRTIRLALDWRQRLAGDARPASGPALSIGTDF